MAATPAGPAALQAAADLGALAPLWLRSQIALAGALGGAVFVQEGDTLRQLALQGADASALQPVVASALAEGRASVLRPPNGAGAQVAQPFALDLPGGRMAGAAAMTLDSAAPARIRAGLQALAWGLAWLRERAARDALAVETARAARMAAAYRLLAAVHEPHGAREAGLRLVTELAHLTGADRAAIALRRRMRTELAAVSHSAEFGRRLRLNRLVTAAMDEALAQRAALTWPAAPDEPNATRAQAALSHDRGGAAVLTVPFRVEGGRWGGAVTLERPAAFTGEEVALVDAAIALGGPALWEKTETQRWLAVKVWQTLVRQTLRLTGPAYPGRKLAVAGVLAAFALVSTWTGPYRVTAEAEIAAAEERSLIAPFDGFLRAAPFGPGDTVAAGTEIARMDDRDLVLERLRWETERRQRELEYGQAIGARNRAEADLIQARIAQVDAQLAQIAAQIERASIRAPFDGVILSGDQSQNIGAALRLGEPLFVLAPAAGHRIRLLIDETRIDDLAPGQTGQLVLAALPGQSFALTFDRLTPVATAADGQNRFRADARLAAPAPGLRPGMQGVAKIDVDRRLRIDIWTRALRDWLRLAWWRWVG